MNTKTQNYTDQLVISYELLALFRWLVEQEEEGLKQFIENALARGLKTDLEKIKRLDLQDMEVMKHTIEDFFGLLEALLAETMDEQTVQKAEDVNLKTSLDQIDTHEYDTQTVISSIEKVTSEEAANPKELLFKELLHRWKPNKKHLLN